MARLKCQPLRRGSKPKYPTKLNVWNDPELLRRHVPAGWLGSREICGVLGVAESTAKAVREHGRGVYFGAFCDPEAREGATKSERLLRLQVRDFVEWLKGQRVI